MKLFSLAFLVAAAALAAPAAQDKQSSSAAADLYNRAVKLLDSGKADTARPMFQKVMSTYPNTPYAQLAKESLDKTVVSAIEFKGTAPLSDKEIKKYFELHAVPLMVGRPYGPDDADQARRSLAELMIKKKVQPRPKDITISTENEPDKKVKVTLTVVR